MSKKIFVSFIIAIFCLAVIVRFFNLTKLSLWHDEAFSALLSKMSFTELTYRTGLDVHPPAYYYFLKIWKALFGSSLFALRAMSVFFSLLSLVFVFFIAQQFKLKKYLIIILLFALTANAFQIQYAQEVRMYSLGVLLTLASVYFLIKLKQNFTWISWVLYSLILIIALYTHYYLLFIIFAQGIMALVWKNKKIILSYVTAGIAFLPWLPTFLAQNKQVQENYWIPKPGWTSLPNTLLRLLIGNDFSLNNNWNWLILIIITLGLIVWAIIKAKNQFKYLALSLTIVPLACALALSIKRAIFLDRYFIFIQLFYFLLIILGINELKLVKFKYSLLGLFIIMNVYSGFIFHFNLVQADVPGMAGAGEFINKNAKPNDQIISGSSFVFFTFKYYNQTNIEPVLYAPEKMLHFSGTALLNKKDIIKNWPQIKTNTNVWLINTTGFGNYQPQVPQSWGKVEEKSYFDGRGRAWIIVTKYE